MPIIVDEEQVVNAEALETQLSSSTNQHLNGFRELISALSNAPESITVSSQSLATLANLCIKSITMIKDFSTIQVTSRVYRNFSETNRMWQKFEDLNSKIERLAYLIEQDRSSLSRGEHPQNTLLSYFYLVELERFHGETMAFVSSNQSIKSVASNPSSPANPNNPGRHDSYNS